MPKQNDTPSVRREYFTEDHHFILEAAMQIGFKPIDDDCHWYSVSDEWIVEFATRAGEAGAKKALSEMKPEETA